MLIKDTGMKVVILENIRSAYNVGNVVRTADALWWKVRIVGYTPSPLYHPKVRKTSLWAEETTDIQQFDFTTDAIKKAKELWLQVISAELTPNAIPLSEFSSLSSKEIAIIFGNEVDGILQQTLDEVDTVVQIPMQGIKESLNIGQSAAIFMWELGK